jgi:hypothetical protein
VKRALAGILLAAAAGCAQLVPAPAVEPSPDPLRAWERVLERFVDESGRVDYAALARDRADLDRFVAWIHDTGIEQQALADHLNAYNALAMYNVLDRGVPDSLAGFEKLRFFVLRKFALRGRELSLYAYENDVIRPLGEERVHFALNCMAAGCPRLPRKPFRAETLDAELERETRRFVEEPRNVRVDAAARTVHLSEIFSFYTADFVQKAPSLIAYVNRWRREPVPEDFRVAFIPYDWSVNRRSSAPRAESRSAGAPPGPDSGARAP